MSSTNNLFNLEEISQLLKRDNLNSINNQMLELKTEIKEIKNNQRLMDLKIELILSKLRKLSNDHDL